MTFRSRSAALLGAALSLVFAAPAAAETLFVKKGGDACTRGADNTCGTIGQAIAAASGGDTIDISADSYGESPQIPAGKDGLILKGVFGSTKVTGTGTGDVLSIASSNVSVSGLGIEVPTDAQSAIASAGGNASFTFVTVTRSAGANEPAVDVTGAGPVTFDRSAIVQSAGTGAAAVRSTTVGGLILVDSLVASTKGDAVTLTAATANRFVRSTVLGAAAGAVGARLTSPSNSSTPKKLATESSTIIGTAAGIRAESLGGVPNSTAGDVALEIRHSTVRGAEGIQLDSSAANGVLIQPGVGNIAATVESSIVHGSSSVRRNPGSGGVLSASNTAALNMTRSDAPPPTPNETNNGGTFACNECSNTPDGQLFAPNSSNLRADAPVIDKGGPLVTDESTKDIGGDPRISDGNQDGSAVSDIGADEFVNKPPIAALRATGTVPKANETIGLISTSLDPEGNAGGGFKEFRWDFGDGKTQTTQFGAVGHAFDVPGTYQVRLTVVDKQGAVSAPSAPVTINVAPAADTTPPVVTITKPADNARLKVTRKRVPGRPARPPIRVTFRGTVTDVTGTKQVELAIRLVKRAKGRTARCEWLSGKRFTRASCDKPVWQKTGRSGGAWSQRTPAGVKLPPGTYEIRVRGIDLFGNTNTVFTKALKNLIKITLR